MHCALRPETASRSRLSGKRSKFQVVSRRRLRPAAGLGLACSPPLYSRTRQKPSACVGHALRLARHARLEQIKKQAPRLQASYKPQPPCLSLRSTTSSPRAPAHLACRCSLLVGLSCVHAELGAAAPFCLGCWAGSLYCATCFQSLSSPTASSHLAATVSTRSDISHGQGCRVPSWTAAALSGASNPGLFCVSPAGLQHCEHCRLCVRIPLNCRPLGFRAGQIRGLLAGTAGVRPGA